MLSLISSFVKINVIVHEPQVPQSRIFLRISKSAIDTAAAGYPNDINKILTTGVINFFFNGK